MKRLVFIISIFIGNFLYSQSCTSSFTLLDFNLSGTATVNSEAPDEVILTLAQGNKKGMIWSDLIMEQMELLL